LIKYISIFLIFIFSVESDQAQVSIADSLKQLVVRAPDDRTKIEALSTLSEYYSFVYTDSAYYYADQLINFSRKHKDAYGEGLGLFRKADALDRVGDYPNALLIAYQSLDIAKTLGRSGWNLMGRDDAFIGHLNFTMGNMKEAISFIHEGINLTTLSGETPGEIYYRYFNLAFIYLNMGTRDSVIYYMKKGKRHLEELKTYLRQPSPWLILGNIYNADNQIDSAEKYYQLGMEISRIYHTTFMETVLNMMIGDIYLQRKLRDSAIYQIQTALAIAKKYDYKLFIMESSGFLSHIYDDGGHPDSALKYIKLMLAEKDSISNDSKLKQFQQIGFEDEKRQKDLENAQARYQAQIKIYALVGALVVFSILAFVFWRNSKQKHRVNLLIKEEKEKVENTLTDLRSTQAQLVQSEKMASLGQLTAGIAHEIQNPLNFVNNFSELNEELIAEMKEELDKGDNAAARVIAGDIAENEQKISYHGRRAEGIVKGMLMHSRSSTGLKEPIDINELVSEYLRLSYHGLRAKDSTFNAQLNTDFDSSIGQMNVVPQEIGRVILNLTTNAFYAVGERNRKMEPGYEPVVTARTKKIGNTLTIQIQDNGIGIPEDILDKIFQPFFTTKPTGQGTGLGLSLSYDIIKAQGGQVKVDSILGDGTVFTIELPAQ
jgi:two-component system, NtrC family, sensor kinase